MSEDGGAACRRGARFPWSRTGQHLRVAAGCAGRALFSPCPRAHRHELWRPEPRPGAI